MDIIQALIESMPYFRAAIRQDVTLSLMIERNICTSLQENR